MSVSVVPPPALRVESVGHAFGLVTVLEDIRFEVARGSVVALVGPSGCGKTTLLHLAAGLLQPSSGRIRRAEGRVACVFQQPRLMPWKTLLDNLALGLQAQGMPRAERHRRARELARRLGLQAEDDDKYPHALSGGMQSRVSLGRALAVEPSLLLLDEAFSALDIGLRLALYDLVLAQVRREGTAVLMITHDLMEAVRLADRILMMAPGPGRLVGEFPLPRPQESRDDAWVYQATGQLIQAEPVRRGFGLDEYAAGRAMGGAGLGQEGVA